MKILALSLMAGMTIAAQTLTPGKLPPKPPAPGQVAPPDATSSAPTSNDAGDGKQNPAASATPRPDGLVFGAGIKLLLVPTTVLDPDGHGYVNGLDASDFQVFDNGKPQKVISGYSELPLSVVVVIQANSEVDPMLPQLRRAAVLLQGLVTGQHGDVAILAFDHRMQVLQDFTDDPNKLDDAMQRLRSGSSTAALNDAVMRADQMLREHDHQNVRRRVIVLISRNIDKGSQIHTDSVVHQMQFDNITVYSVDISRFKTAFFKQPDYPRPANGGVPPEAIGSITGQPQTQTTVIQQQDGNWLNAAPAIERNIKELFTKSPAEAFSYFTGGNRYSFSNEKTLELAVSDIGKDLNSQYLLSYELTNKTDPGFHTIKVTVDRPGLVVRTRPGYWGGSE